ncbi:unnamed protein product [Cuscuta epithymum]|uniref:Uncharacterized protein n=1 Tax=Cuscuta epithymum TaxID=186058 RepID=A0AAV0EUM1_9ASTE|nr:unnamed protein product [Cuscuta epithymum]
MSEISFHPLSHDQSRQVDDACMAAAHKRTASTDGVTGNPKRRELDTNETLDDVEWQSDFPMTLDSSSSSDSSIIDNMMRDECIDILSNKVENDSQLKQMAEEIFQSLKNVVEHGEQVATLVAGVKRLFDFSVFNQACVDTSMKDPYLICYIEIYSNGADAKERMEDLKRDRSLGCILQETETTAIIRGVLSIIVGYWCDKDFYNKLDEAIKGAIKEARRKNPIPKREMVYDTIIDIDVSSDVEGLKEALATKYRNDPKHDYERICEEIDRDKSYYERVLGSDCPRRIRWLKILWIDNSFHLRGFGNPPPMLCGG